MVERLKKAWRQLKQGTPGERFAKFHARRDAMRRSGPWKYIFPPLGFALVAIGIILLPAPGPGMLVILVGLTLLARESLMVARALDWAELRVRRLGARRA